MAVLPLATQQQNYKKTLKALNERSKKVKATKYEIKFFCLSQACYKYYEDYLLEDTILHIVSQFNSCLSLAHCFL